MAWTEDGIEFEYTDEQRLAIWRQNIANDLERIEGYQDQIAFLQKRIAADQQAIRELETACADRSLQM